MSWVARWARLMPSHFLVPICKVWNNIPQCVHFNPIYRHKYPDNELMTSQAQLAPWGLRCICCTTLSSLQQAASPHSLIVFQTLQTPKTLLIVVTLFKTCSIWKVDVFLTSQTFREFAPCLFVPKFLKVKSLLLICHWCSSNTQKSSHVV